jgi:hypothetical protein
MASTFAVLSTVFLLFSRFVVHPWNFSPVMALFMKAGQSSRRSIVPLFMALIVSDLVLGFSPTLLFGYAAYGLVTWAMSSRRQGWLKMSVLGSVLFFVLSNLGVWFLDRMYPHTPLGLVNCYSAALPFFGRTLLGNLFYGGLLFELLPRLRSLGLRWGTLRG